MPYSRLRAFLQQRGGAVPFRDFMAAALYDPEFGYYSRKIKTVGRGGDFSTASTLSPLLGRAILAWMQEAGPVRNIIEVGAGNGVLAETILNELGWWARRKVRFWIVEKSPVLQAQQQTRLAKFSQVRWASSVAEALQQADGIATIYSNELVDAFPMIWIEWRDGKWQEVWIELSAEGKLVETLRPLSEKVSSVALKADWPKREGQRWEIPWSYYEWMREWRSAAQQVQLLTVDYGSVLPEALGRRLDGTLRGYLRHERKQGVEIYQNMGSQDLTADVCFDDLILWGQELGLETSLHLTQGEFLQRYGKPQMGSREETYLLREDGAGSAFRVLAQVARASSP
jgi:SAM-dependent MidA family methyltransferase